MVAESPRITVTRTREIIFAAMTLIGLEPSVDDY